MAIPIQYVTEGGRQEIKRGESIVFTIEIEPQSSSTPTNLTMDILEGDGVDGDSVSPAWHSGSPTASGTVITLPAITPGASVTRGYYTAVVEFDSGGYTNTPRYIPLSVF